MPFYCPECPDAAGGDLTGRKPECLQRGPHLCEELRAARRGPMRSAAWGSPMRTAACASLSPLWPGFKQRLRLPTAQAIPSGLRLSSTAPASRKRKTNRLTNARPPSGPRSTSGPGSSAPRPRRAAPWRGPKALDPARSQIAKRRPSAEASPVPRPSPSWSHGGGAGRGGRRRRFKRRRARW